MRGFLPLVVVVGLALVAVAVRSAAPPLPTLPAMGGLTYEVRDAEGGAPIPCKLTLIGVEGAATPQLTHNDIGRQEGDAVLAFNRVMSLSGVGVVPLPVGLYDVYVSRGPEWELFTARRVRVTAKGATVQARLKHVV